MRSIKTRKSYGRAFKGAILLAVILLLTGFTWNDVAPMVNITYRINGQTITRDVYFSPDASGKIFYDELNNDLFNTSQTTYYGYIEDMNNITFRTYQAPTQTLQSGYTSYELSDITVNSVQNFKWYSRTSNMNIGDYSTLIIMVILGIMLISK